jgi:hypothetical protein
MTEEEAIRLAVAELERRGLGTTPNPVGAHHQNRHMRLGKNRSGWIVLFPLDAPRGFEPNQLSVEVYEPDGEVNIPPIL